MSDAPIVTVTDDKVIYRASALGGCLRALALARQEMDADYQVRDAVMVEAFARGHRCEEWYLERTYPGDELCQFPVKLPITSKIEIAGHLDTYTEDAVVEVKSQSFEEWTNWTPDSFNTLPLWGKYKWQFSVYMLATGLPLQLVRVVEQRTGLGEINGYSIKDDYVIEKPFYSLAEVKVRVLTVEAMAHRNLSNVPCDASMYPCPYWKTHVEEPVEEVVDSEMEDLAAKWLISDSLEKSTKKQKDKVRKVLLEKLGESRKIRLSESGTVVHTYKVDVPEQVRKAGSAQYVTIKPRKKSEDKNETETSGSGSSGKPGSIDPVGDGRSGD